ncbi:MAG: hypothetical protein JWP27_845 [Flaviaesturariibacter sp.]|nr:hypothetical protein [Flaviaesturariibacter sp.]
MKYIFSTIAIFALALASCKKFKDAPDDLAGDLYLHGRAFLVTEGTATDTTAAPAKTLKINYAGAGRADFLMSTVTDSLGYFTFDNLRKDITYTIWSDYSDSVGAYAGARDVKLTASIDTARVFLGMAPGNNAVYYTVLDNTGHPVSGVDVCFFTSPVVANDSCMGSTYHLLTNPLGKTSKTNLPVRDYYVHFRGGFGTLQLRARDTLVTTGTGQIYRRTVTVR